MSSSHQVTSTGTGQSRLGEIEQQQPTQTASFGNKAAKIAKAIGRGILAICTLGISEGIIRGIQSYNARQAQTALSDLRATRLIDLGHSANEKISDLPDPALELGLTEPEDRRALQHMIDHNPLLKTQNDLELAHELSASATKVLKELVKNPNPSPRKLTELLTAMRDIINEGTFQTRIERSENPDIIMESAFSFAMSKLGIAENREAMESAYQTLTGESAKVMKDSTYFVGSIMTEDPAVTRSIMSLGKIRDVGAMALGLALGYDPNDKIQHDMGSSFGEYSFPQDVPQDMMAFFQKEYGIGA